MTDIEKLYALLKEFGVGFSMEWNHKEAVVIDCYEGDAKIDGYSCFFTDFYFDLDGKFIRMGAWE